MTTSYPYDSSNNFPTSQDNYSSEAPQRKRLQLKPRSKPGSVSHEVVRPRRHRATSARGDPFGSALPREQVLKSRGIDVAKMDEKIARKAVGTHFTTVQETQLEAVRVQLTAAEEELRHANEKELPEESYRVAADAKRNELNTLLETFGRLNVDNSSGGDESGGGSGGGRFQQQQHHAVAGGDADDSAVYASFSSVHRRRPQQGSGDARLASGY